jgi:hypothetical protein
MSSVNITINEDLLRDCAIALRYVANDVAGQSQRPYLCEASDTFEYSQALQIDAVLRQAKLDAKRGGLVYRERRDVLNFQQKFEVPMACEPSFLDERTFQFRYKFLHEELKEFYESYLAKDMHGAADALVDLAYVLHGTALMMGLPWPVLWEEVQRKNMLKERATRVDQPKRGSALDVIKPVGWAPPDHTAALGAGPWPTFKAGQS